MQQRSLRDTAGKVVGFEALVTEEQLQSFTDPIATKSRYREVWWTQLSDDLYTVQVLFHQPS